MAERGLWRGAGDRPSLTTAFEEMAEHLRASKAAERSLLRFTTRTPATEAQERAAEDRVLAEIAAWRAAILGERPLTILVTASRKLKSPLIVRHTLWTFDRFKPRLVHGAARGGDTFAHDCALAWGWPEPITYPITDEDWRRHGKGYGHIRNRRMHDEQRPDLVVALRWPGESNGTDGMVDHARRCGTPVWLVREDEWIAPRPPYPWTVPPPAQYTLPSG